MNSSGVLGIGRDLILSTDGDLIYTEEDWEALLLILGPFLRTNGAARFVLV